MTAWGDPHQGAPWRDRETLRRLYHDEGLSLAETADRLDCAKSTVRDWMEHHDIPRRYEGGPLVSPYAVANNATGGDE